MCTEKEIIPGIGKVKMEGRKNIVQMEILMGVVNGE